MSYETSRGFLANLRNIATIVVQLSTHAHPSRFRSRLSFRVLNAFVCN